jgi:SAM-dependent methyltransferase
VTSAERWLAANWPFVRTSLPSPPSRVLEIGCGPMGGFVPMLTADGYQAIGVDPEAPDGDEYARTEFESYESRAPVDAVVACTSLHHVADLGVVLDRVSSTLATRGALVVVEWASEAFDLATAQWCFERLRAPASDDDHGWLERHHERWLESGGDWDAYLAGWLAEEGLHSGSAIVEAIDARFEAQAPAYGPYFFADLADTSMDDEQAAIDGGRIRANGIRLVSGRGDS